MKIARRNFLSMLAAVPFMSSCRNPTSEPQSPHANAVESKNFYVWIHGIFGITFQEKRILLISPQLVESNNKHIYKVGRATGYDKKNKAYIGTQDLKDAGTYLIEGLGSLGPPTEQFPPDQRDSALLTTGVAKLNVPKTFYFVLPYPLNLIPLRPFNTKVFSKAKCDPQDPNCRIPDGGNVPLTHVFEYGNVSPGSVKITQNENVFWGPGQSNHLHIYAEPDPICYDDHSQCMHDMGASFVELQSRYDNIPKFTVQNSQPDCALLNNVLPFAATDLNLKEQFALFEWYDQCQEFPHRFDSAQVHATRGTMDCPQQLVLEDAAALQKFKEKKRKLNAQQTAVNAKLRDDAMQLLEKNTGTSPKRPRKKSD